MGSIKNFRKLINALVIHASSVMCLFNNLPFAGEVAKRSFVQKLDAIYPSKMTHPLLSKVINRPQSKGDGKRRTT